MRPAADHGLVWWGSACSISGATRWDGPFTAWQFVEQSLGAIGLMITANFVELLADAADELAGFATLLSPLVRSRLLSVRRATFS